MITKTFIVANLILMHGMNLIWLMSYFIVAFSPLLSEESFYVKLVRSNQALARFRATSHCAHSMSRKSCTLLNLYQNLTVGVSNQGFVHASDFVLGNDFCDLTNFFFKFFSNFLFATTYIFWLHISVWNLNFKLKV